MGKERPELQTDRLSSPEKPTFPIYALDGIGGCGKSHISRLLAEQLKEEGLAVVTPKIGGLGDSPRVQRLKEIQGSRTALFHEGHASEKHLQDQAKDRIFRLAIRYQAR